MGAYHFCTPGVESQAWILFPQWSYFRDLVRAGLDEFRTGVVNLPGLSRNTLLSIICACHSQIGPHLTTAEAIELLEHAEQFGLVNEKGFANPAFESIIFLGQTEIHIFLESLSLDKWIPELLVLAAKNVPCIDAMAIPCFRKKWKRLSKQYPEEIKLLPEEWMMRASSPGFSDLTDP